MFLLVFRIEFRRGAQDVNRDFFHRFQGRFTPSLPSARLHVSQKIIIMAQTESRFTLFAVFSFFFFFGEIRKHLLTKRANDKYGQQNWIVNCQ